MTGRPRNSFEDPALISSRSAPDENGCWIWQHEKNKAGYGRIRIAYKAWMAHRAAWVHAHGPIPGGLTVDHTCYVTSCVNVAHLRLLSLADNIRARRVNMAPACKYGHERTPVNTTASGACRPCKQRRTAEWRRKNDWNTTRRIRKTCPASAKK